MEMKEVNIKINPQKIITKTRKLKAEWLLMADDLRAYHGVSVTMFYDVWAYVGDSEEPERIASALTLVRAEELVQKSLVSGRCAFSRKWIELEEGAAEVGK
tara:strand:+ start:389 stop:691 length:303 start_codon:yes stop_codon:yes gene_type:complete